MLPTRKPNRLFQYDYSSPNGYFITICTRNRECIFWDKSYNNCDTLSEFGLIVQKYIENIPKYYANAEVENYKIMPNHVHIILILHENEKQIGVSTIIGQMKRLVSKEAGIQIWQKSFHDHIIRKEEYEKIWNYVEYNHLKWKEDCFYISDN